MTLFYIALFLAIMAIILILIMMHQARTLKSEFVRIPRSQLGIKVCLISDIHIGLLRVPEDVSKAISDNKPDMIVLQGTCTKTK